MLWFRRCYSIDHMEQYRVIPIFLFNLTFSFSKITKRLCEISLIGCSRQDSRVFAQNENLFTKSIWSRVAKVVLYPAKNYITCGFPNNLFWLEGLWFVGKLVQHWSLLIPLFSCQKVDLTGIWPKKWQRLFERDAVFGRRIVYSRREQSSDSEAAQVFTVALKRPKAARPWIATCDKGMQRNDCTRHSSGYNNKK